MDKGAWRASGDQLQGTLAENLADRLHQLLFLVGLGQVVVDPDAIRAELLAYWQQCTWPGDPTYFLSMLHMHDTGRLELPGRGGG
jgi:hypothetical protein